MAENSLLTKPASGTLDATPPWRRVALTGAAWTGVGYAVRTVLRFGNNLIITRLLFPELLGVMLLVNTFILGLSLFSDIGIFPAIVQSKRGDSARFLNTAFTIQVLRGLLLGLLACLIAWPVSRFYEQPLLLYALPAAGLSAVFQGFNSTRKAIANRNLLLDRLTLIEVGAYVTGLVVMITWALISPTIWALVAGGVVTAFVEMVLTHVALPGNRDRFSWDAESARELYRFGRWILFSTALTFLAIQSDRLVIGKLVDARFLGIYGIALMLARMADDAIRQLGYRVLFPTYSRLQHSAPERLYAILRKTRLMLISLSWVAALFFLAAGNHLVGLLYDERYVAAGWMLQILALGTLVGVLSVTYDNVLIARGNTFAVAALNAIYLVILVSAILTGHHYLGEPGVVAGVAAASWLIYPVKALWLHQLKLWQPEVDLPVIGLATLLTAGLYLFFF
jgi:O-antigen/teichoic acid export membrane protein